MSTSFCSKVALSFCTFLVGLLDVLIGILDLLLVQLIAHRRELVNGAHQRLLREHDVELIAVSQSFV